MMLPSDVPTEYLASCSTYPIGHWLNGVCPRCGLHFQRGVLITILCLEDAHFAVHVDCPGS